MKKKKLSITCSSCSEEYTIHFNPRSGVLSYCPFCAEEMDETDRVPLLTSEDDLNLLADDYDDEDCYDDNN